MNEDESISLADLALAAVRKQYPNVSDETLRTGLEAAIAGFSAKPADSPVVGELVSPEIEGQELFWPDAVDQDPAILTAVRRLVNDSVRAGWFFQSSAKVAGGTLLFFEREKPSA